MKKTTVKNSLMKKTASAPEQQPVIISPEQGETVTLQTGLQSRYSSGKCLEPSLKNGWAEKKDDMDCTHPEAVTVQWKNPSGRECLLFLAENRDFSGAKKWKTFRSKKIYNLLPGKEYFLKVRCGRHDSETVKFSTLLQTPRFIHVPGVTNVRDLGGLSGCGGKKIRFGMIYRGAQYEKWTCAPGLTPGGKRILLDDLKLKTILDLRWENEGKCGLKNEIRKYSKIPILAYATWHGPTASSTGIFSEEQMDHVRKIFLLFARKNSYPLYFHCQGGGDRTGTIAFLLETVLGVSRENAEKEYEFSNLSTSGIRLRSSEVWTRFMEKLDEYAPGKSIGEKVSAYLYQCGVKEDTLEKIRRILLEEA